MIISCSLYKARFSVVCTEISAKGFHPGACEHGKRVKLKAEHYS